MYRFYPVLMMGKTDLFTQFYPVLPNWFYPMGKTNHANTGFKCVRVCVCVAQTAGLEKNDEPG